MLPAHKAIFDRLGKALDREIKRIEIDLDPPRCRGRAETALGIPPLPVGWAQHTKLIDGPYDINISIADAEPAVFGGASIIEATPEDVKKYGDGKVSKDVFLQAMKQVTGETTSMPDFLKTMKPHPETKQEKRARRKGKSPG